MTTEQLAYELLEQAFKEEANLEFEKAQGLYEDIQNNYSDTECAHSAMELRAKARILEEEKDLLKRIHENAIIVLTDIGMNIAESSDLLNVVMSQDGVDFEQSEAVFVPLKRDYIERCLDLIPRDYAGNPGKNTFGTGGTPPFLKREGSDELRPADRSEFTSITQCARDRLDIIDMFSIPVQTDRSVSDIECAQIMDQGFPGLKMIATKNMRDEDLGFFQGREDWIDGTALMVALTPMESMVQPFLRSCHAGLNLLLLDLTISGFSGPASPEALLTLIHAQELFMMVVAQSITPGIVCMHGGIPGVTSESGDLDYSSLSHTLSAAAMARLNLWVTGIPSAQSGGSTSIAEDVAQAVEESAANRNMLREFGVHLVRHAYGAMNNLNSFSLDKFVEDCEREREARRMTNSSRATEQPSWWPLSLPKDEHVLEGIREMAEKGCNYRATDHCLRNVDAFQRWERKAAEMNEALLRSLR